MLIGAGSFLLAVAGWGLYTYTKVSTVSDYERSQLEVEKLRAERRELVRDLRASRQRVNELEQQAVYVERSQAIDSQACSALRASVTDLQSEAADLREQLAFYRGIVSPEESRAGVRVYEFKLSSVDGARRYRFELVVIQSVRHDKRVSGTIRLVGVGRDAAGAETRWHLAGNGDEASENLLFSLKYFAEFAGEFELPEDVVPVRVEVVLDPSGGNLPEVEESYDWASLTAGSGGQ